MVGIARKERKRKGVSYDRHGKEGEEERASHGFELQCKYFFKPNADVHEALHVHGFELHCKYLFKPNAEMYMKRPWSS